MTGQARASGAFTLPAWKDFLDWWLGGLRHCLPSAMRKGLGRSRFVLAMEAGGFGLQRHGTDGMRELAQLASLQGVALDRWLGSGWQRKTPLTLRVPADAVFTRTVRLPAAAAGNLRRVLQFEMDRLTPFADAEVLFDYRVLNRQPARGQIEVELAVLRKDLVDGHLAQLEAGNQAPRVVDAAGLWDGANLLRSAHNGRRRASGLGGWLTVAVLAALTAAVLVTPLWQAREVVTALDARLQQARGQAAAVARLQRQLDDGAALANFVARRQQQRIPTVELLLELTERLPDDTWLQQLAIRGTNIEMQGESERATLLIETLEDSSYFESVAFRAPLTQARGTNAERFSIVMTLSGRTAP